MIVFTGNPDLAANFNPFNLEARATIASAMPVVAWVAENFDALDEATRPIVREEAGGGGQTHLHRATITEINGSTADPPGATFNVLYTAIGIDDSAVVVSAAIPVQRKLVGINYEFVPIGSYCDIREYPGVLPEDPPVYRLWLWESANLVSCPNP